jgi:hypothetical protein
VLFQLVAHCNAWSLASSYNTICERIARTPEGATNMREWNQLTKEQVQAIVELRKAKVRHEKDDLIKRFEEQALQMIRHDQQHKDYVPDEASELELAKEIATAYVDAAPGGEVTLRELKDLMRRFAIDPRHVMTWAKSLLIEPEHSAGEEIIDQEDRD